MNAGFRERNHETRGRGLLAAGLGLWALLASAADPAAPARFRVTSEVLCPDPGPYTATFASRPVNSWLGNASFEPLVFRQKFHLQGDSPNELILPASEIDGFNRYKSGLWDGARARVYRVRDGKLVKVREDVVASHQASGWVALGAYGEKLVPPEVTSIRFRLPDWSRRDVPYYVCVKTVDSAGQESPASAAASLVFPAGAKTKDAGPEPPAIAIKPRQVIGQVPLPPPSNVAAAIDAATGIVTLSWQAPAHGSPSGYRPCLSDYAPETHQGFHLRLRQTPSDPAQALKNGDMVFLEKEFRDWPRGERYSNRVYGSHQGANPSLIPFDTDANKAWSLVEHPGPLPAAFTEGGRTCLFLELRADEDIALKQYNHSSPAQDWYGVLDPEKTYVVEFWARQEGLPNPRLSFSFAGPYARQIAPLEFPLGSGWQHCRGTFRVPARLSGRTGTGQMVLACKGPGKVWLDNWRVYEDGTAYADFLPADYAALAESGLAALRTHALIKTPRGYSLHTLTNPPGVAECSGTEALAEHTPASVFRICAKAKADPWLQVEMCLAEEEWQGFVEYLAAPWDPRRDTAATKPWAWKRVQQGHPAPWLDDFPRVLFEISNETWNFLFRPWCFNGTEMRDESSGRVYRNGEVYGLFQEYVIGVMKASPYWTADAGRKVQFVLGGWAIQTTATGYGPQAASLSPSSRHVTVAEYNGGWDEREAPAEAVDAAYFKALAQVNQIALPRAQALAAVRAAAGNTWLLGTYEAGPGYNMNGLNNARMTPQQVEAESQVMKSLAAGTATLDSFLARSAAGFALQNFFTFSRGRNYWTSHARLENGGQAYPSWLALALYNRHATGDFLKVEALSVPSVDLPRAERRKALLNAPLLGVYATRKGDDWHVFVLSRKIDNYPSANDDGCTPVTLELPFAAVQSATLYRLAGDPRAHNLDEARVKVEELALPAGTFANPFVISDKTGASPRGIPPGATFLYVFTGTRNQ